MLITKLQMHINTILSYVTTDHVTIEAPFHLFVTTNESEKVPVVLASGFQNAIIDVALRIAFISISHRPIWHHMIISDESILHSLDSEHRAHFMNALNNKRLPVAPGYAIGGQIGALGFPATAPSAGSPTPQGEVLGTLVFNFPSRSIPGQFTPGNAAALAQELRSLARAG